MEKALFKCFIIWLTLIFPHCLLEEADKLLTLLSSLSCAVLSNKDGMLFYFP
jgi:hypothetical protein